MANLVISTNTYAAESGVTLHRGGATNWKMLASAGNFHLQHQRENEGDWITSLLITEDTQGGNATFKGSVYAPAFVGNLTGTADNSNKLNNLSATSFLQTAGGQTLTGVIHLSTSGAINASDTRTILSFDNPACTNAESGTCIGALGYGTTIRGSELYHAYSATQKATILTAANYNSYSPSLTGGGASGTWGINITGSANYATTANQSDWLTLYLGSDDVARYVFFQDSEMYTNKMKACYSNSFKFNPANGCLYVSALSYGTSQVSGHLYLIGAYESSSTSNTSQIVFGTSSNNHVALSSNKNCLIINPTISSTTGQIALYTDRMSKFPNGIDSGALNASSITAGTITTSGTVTASVIKASSQLIGTLFLDNNGAYTAYGTPPPEGNITGVIGRVYFQI